MKGIYYRETDDERRDIVLFEPTDLSNDNKVVPGGGGGHSGLGGAEV